MKRLLTAAAMSLFALGAQAEEQTSLVTILTEENPQTQLMAMVLESSLSMMLLLFQGLHRRQ